jgi:hypothetical protein
MFGWSDPETYDLCGNPNGSNFFEKKMKIDIIVGHSDPSVTIELSSTLDQGAEHESWAFREFELLYEPQDDCA